MIIFTPVNRTEESRADHGLVLGSSFHIQNTDYVVLYSKSAVHVYTPAYGGGAFHYLKAGAEHSTLCFWDWGKAMIIQRVKKV